VSAATNGQSQRKKRLAAIDIGSNSIRLMVAEATPDGDYRLLDDEKETTRLAHGLARTGTLSDEAMKRSIAALGRMKAIAQGYHVDQLEVIATSAVREASNRRRFVRQVRDQLGLTVEVIPAHEEGRLSFRSVQRHFNLKDTNAVIVDLGGGSAEVVFSANGIIEDIYSLPIGSVRLTERYVKSDPMTNGAFALVKRRVSRQVRQIIGTPDFTPHVMIGSGGTFMALANVSIKMRGGDGPPTIGGYEIARSEVRHVLEYLRHLPLRARRNVPGLHADRADIIVAGVLVIERLMKFFKVNRLLIHDRGIRDGLLLNLIGELFGNKPRLAEEQQDPLAGVRHFAAACGFEQRHSNHVAKLALQLFDQVREPLELPLSERLLLEAAALLHEIGYLINYEKHHHHSYHLIMHGNFRGLTPRQREIVANVARYHRRSGPKKKHDNFARLPPDEQTTVRRLSAILRLADGLDRTHLQHVAKITCKLEGRRLMVLAHAQQPPDVDLWGGQQKGKLFEKVFGVKVMLGWQPTTSSNGKAAATETRRELVRH
jgi:exopolyphosphatase/guanosine-5'-triphosphate,3'-diphosphate pyrophosphatase